MQKLEKIKKIVNILIKIRRWCALKKMKFAIVICRVKGVQIGERCRFTGIPDVGSEPYLIKLGNDVILTDGIKFLTHDGGIRVFTGEKNFSHVNKLGKIEIKDNSFIGANSILLPNIEIGPNSIVGAGSVVTKSIPPNTVYAGNPAKFICTLEEYIEKCNLNTIDIDVKDKEKIKNYFWNK